jgi:hypothetical protein
MIILIIFSEDYKLQRCSLCKFPQLLVASSLLNPNIQGAYLVPLKRIDKNDVNDGDDAVLLL